MTFEEQMRVLVQGSGKLTDEEAIKLLGCREFAQLTEQFEAPEIARLRFIKHLVDTGYIDEFMCHGRVAYEEALNVEMAESHQ